MSSSELLEETYNAGGGTLRGTRIPSRRGTFSFPEPALPSCLFRSTYVDSGNETGSGNTPSYFMLHKPDVSTRLDKLSGSLDPEDNTRQRLALLSLVDSTT